jgi:sporulation-control protein
MLLRRMMSRLGVGSAHVDLILNKNAYKAGDFIEGQVHIHGGTVEQKVNKLDVDLIRKTIFKGKEETDIVATIPVSDGFIIQENEKKVLPFRYQLPENIVPSQPGISYRFVTRLDIEDGVDTLDFDYIQIVNES